MSKPELLHLADKLTETILEEGKDKTLIVGSFTKEGDQQPSIFVSKQLQPRLLFNSPFPLRWRDGFQPISLPTAKMLNAYSMLAGGLQKLIAKLLNIDRSGVVVEFGLQVIGDGLNARSAFQLSVENWDELSEDMKTLVSQACFDFIHVLELNADELPRVKENCSSALNSTSAGSGQSQATDVTMGTGANAGLIGAVGAVGADGDLNELSLATATEFRKQTGALNFGSGSQIIAGNSSQGIPTKTEGIQRLEEKTELIEFSGKQVAFANYNARVCCLHNKGGTGILEIEFDIERYLVDLLEAEKKRWLVAGTYEKKTLKNGDVEQKLVGNLSIQTTL